MEHETLREFIIKFGYIAIFFGTIIDHSGIPLPIVFSGYFSAIGLLDKKLAFFFGFIAVLTSNVASYFIGIYFSNIRFRKFIKYSKIVKIIENSERVIEKNKYWMILFSNFFAVWGKFVFFTIGRQKVKFRFFYVFVSLASLFYTSIYFYLGNKLHYLLQSNEDMFSTLIGLFSLLFFFVLYKLSLNSIQKNKS